MARPSLKTERTEEILAAYERCIARYGVEGATLERVSEEAGLARALIRHNIGNKDELMEAFIANFIERSNHSTRQLLDSLPEERRVLTLIDWLFDPAHSNSHEVQVFGALIIAANDLPNLAGRLREWNEVFVNSLAKEIRQTYASVSIDQVNAVAAGIAGIYFNVESIGHLGRMKEFRHQSKEASQMLISILENNEGLTS